MRLDPVPCVVQKNTKSLVIWINIFKSTHYKFEKSQAKHSTRGKL
jgi:hypothetical protein